MKKRAAATATIRWSLLLVALVLLVGLGWLFWKDLEQGRTEREVNRIQGAQKQIGEAAPAPVVPITPTE